LRGIRAVRECLVVDDTEAIRTIIRRVLTGAGYPRRFRGLGNRNRGPMDPACMTLFLVDAPLGVKRGTSLIHSLVAEDPLGGPPVSP